MAVHNEAFGLTLDAVSLVLIFVALGLTFARRPFVFVDRIGSLASGKAMPLAILFTRSGYGNALTVLAIAGTLVAVRMGTPALIPALLVAAQLLGQLCSNVMKRIVARLRPEVWHFRQEMGFAYPSGHAVTAIVFYVGWAAIASQWNVPDPVHVLIFIVAAVWALGIGWSRLSLGAHRLTDVLGGYSLGFAWLAVFLALRAALQAAAT